MCWSCKHVKLSKSNPLSSDSSCISVSPPKAGDQTKFLNSELNVMKKTWDPEPDVEAKNTCDGKTNSSFIIAKKLVLAESKETQEFTCQRDE